MRSTLENISLVFVVIFAFILVGLVTLATYYEKWKKYPVRDKLYQWLRKRYCEEATIPPLWLRILYRVLNPLYRETCNVCHYDFMRNNVNIDGCNISRAAFQWFNDSNNAGKKFRFVKIEDGVITIQELTNDREKKTGMKKH
jgi:hypothetical protein